MFKYFLALLLISSQIYGQRLELIESFIGIKLENSIFHSSASLSVSRDREAKLQESPLTSSGKGIAWLVIGFEGGERFTPV